MYVFASNHQLRLGLVIFLILMHFKIENIFFKSGIITDNFKIQKILTPYPTPLWKKSIQIFKIELFSVVGSAVGVPRD